MAYDGHMTPDELRAALAARDQEVAWLDKEIERLTEGRRVVERGTAQARAWLRENRDATSINVNAYTLALDQIEALEVERDEWKRRAKAHGCDTDRGDPDCG